MAHTSAISRSGHSATTYTGTLHAAFPYSGEDWREYLQETSQIRNDAVGFRTRHNERFGDMVDGNAIGPQSRFPKP